MTPSTILPSESAISAAGLPTSTAVPNRSPVPPLENGDRLSRNEFERRYATMPDCKKAELIEGEVHMPSPVRLNSHASPHAALIALLGVYQAWTPGTKLGDNPTVRLDLDNEPQPDAVLLIEGGQAKIDADDYILGAPEFVAEVTASTVSIDLGKKLRAYRRNGVKEYLVWRVLDQAFDFFVLRKGEYEALPAGGIIRSEAFPGLWIDAPNLLRNNLRAAHESLLEGLKSPEHIDFVKRLAQPS